MNLIALFAILVSLSNCAPLAIGAAGVAGGTAVSGAVQERGVGGRAVDGRIQTEINRQWLAYNPNLLRWLDLKVFNRRVLVMGRAPSEDIRGEAIRLAWKPLGVREVINEVSIGDTVSYVRSTGDSGIATLVDSKLTLTKGIKNQNYTTRVLDGVVYVMGLARTPEEKEKVLNVVRTTTGVKRVVSYIE